MMNMIFSDIGDIGFLSAGKFVEGDGTVHPRRQLDSAVLLVGCGGCYPIAQDGRGYSLRDGTYMLLFPGHEHYGTAPASGGQSHYWCHFRIPEMSAEFSEDIREGAVSIPEFGTLCHPERFMLLFHQLIDSAEREYCEEESREQICGLYIRLLLSELYEDILLSRQPQAEETDGSEKRKNIGIKIREYLRVHARDTVRATELSELFHYNPDYLAAVFKKEYHMTMRMYVNGIRIGEAKKMLTESETKIGDIALAVGFRDEKYFMKTFKKTVGVTPSEYRLSHYRIHINIR